MFYHLERVIGICGYNIILTCNLTLGIVGIKIKKNHLFLTNELMNLYLNTVYVPIDAHCASADLRVRVYFKIFFFFASTESTITRR